MSQKKITSILASIIFLIISYFFGGNYLEHQEKNNKNIEITNYSIQEAKTFTLSDVVELEQADFFYTPYMKLNDILVQKIQNAKKEVLLEVYMFTETRILEALKKAHNKGVRVQVVLEKYPYKSANVNNKLFDMLKKSGIDVVWSDSSDYKLNHSKMLVIDDEAFISTGNITYSTFKHNRDFFIQTSDTNVVAILKQIFADDYAGEKVSRYHPNLVVSPHYSRKKITTMLQSAEKDIKIYMQYFLDKEINQTLKNIKNKKDINIQIIVDRKNIDSEEITDLRNHGIDITTIKTKMHAKAILIDNNYLFVGSENFSKSSLNYNREVGIILKDEEVVKRFLEIFHKDTGK